MHGSRNERRSCLDPWTSSNLAVVLANVSPQLTSGKNTTLLLQLLVERFLYSKRRGQLRARSFLCHFDFAGSFPSHFMFTFVIRIRSGERLLSIQLLVVLRCRRASRVQWQMIKVHKTIISNFCIGILSRNTFIVLRTWNYWIKDSSCRFFQASRCICFRCCFNARH